MKKLSSFIKNNSKFLLFIIPFIYVSFLNKAPNNDIWFLLSLGRYAVGNGIPNVDPFTIHEGLSYVMQQWGSAVIYWGMFETFGKFSILFIVYFMLFSLMFLFYKLCKCVNKNSYVGIILTTITFLFVSTFMVNRPQLFTYFILLLEVLILEKYVNSNNKKILILLPILSLVLINLHASMWYFQFIFILPFLVNAIYIKGITLDKYNIKPIIIVMLIMVLCGLINPYGIEAMTFIFKSYGVDIINNNVIEMAAPSLSGGYNYYFYIVLALLFIFIMAQRYLKNFKLDIRHICFILGTCFLYLNHIKCFPYFVFIYMYCFAYGIKKVKFPNFSFKYLKAIFRGLYNGTLIMLFITFFMVLYLMTKTYDFSSTLSFNLDDDDIADFILENYDKDEVRLYCTYNEGGYYEYRNLKVYIDGKAELFLKEHNGKADILEEAINVEKDESDYDYKAFVDKYNFTHLIILEDSNFKNYMDTDKRYEIVYTSYFDGQEDNPYRYVYSLVDKVK